MSPCRALNQELTAGSPDREKRQRDEAQSDPVEAAKLFRAVIGEIGVLRKTRDRAVGAQKKARSKKRHDFLATTRSQLDDAFSRAEALSENILPLSLTHPVANRENIIPLSLTRVHTSACTKIP